jgi:hypothetical protein
VPSQLHQLILNFSGKVVQFITRNIKNVTILIVTCIFSVQIYQLVKSSNPLPNEQNIQADIQIGLRIDEIDRNELDLASLELWESYYTYNTNLPLVIISVEYIYISPLFISRNDIKSVCFQGIYIENKDVRVEIKESEPHLQNLVTNYKCAESEMNYIPSKNFAVLVYNPYKYGFRPPYFFPFDKRTINFDLSTKLTFRNDEDNDVDIKSIPNVRAVGRAQNSGESIWLLKNNDETAPKRYNY